MQQMAAAQVSGLLSDLINDAFFEVLSASEIGYEEIISFQKDDSGTITALQTDMVTVNRLKSETINLLNEKAEHLTIDQIGIPVGNLLLPELFSARGPKIPIRLTAITDSNAEFYNHFSEAGINQTLHQLTMVVSVDVAVLVLGQTSSFTVNSEVVVAETVIVGDVPSTFLQTGGNYESKR